MPQRGATALDGDAVAAEVKTGKTFYNNDPTTKETGSGTKTLNPANENVVAGYYDTTTLSTVDADLAVGNIKDGVTIFGKLGTYAPSPAQEDEDEITGLGTTAYTNTRKYDTINIAAAGDWNMNARSLTVTAGADIEACTVVVYHGVEVANKLKLQLDIDGVQVSESAYLAVGGGGLGMWGTKDSLSAGARVIQPKVHNYDSSGRDIMAVCYYTGGGAVNS